MRNHGSAENGHLSYRTATATASSRLRQEPRSTTFDLLVRICLLRPEQPLHPIDDVPPLLSTRGRWQEATGCSNAEEAAANLQCSLEALLRKSFQPLFSTFLTISRLLAHNGTVTKRAYALHMSGANHAAGAVGS